MGLRQPGRTLVVKVGQRTGLERRGGGGIAGQDAVGVAGHHFRLGDNGVRQSLEQKVGLSPADPAFRCETDRDQ